MSGEWGHTRNIPSAVGLWVDWVRCNFLREQPHSGIDGDHLIIMREVGINFAVQREGFWIRIECPISLGIVLYGGARQTSDEFIDIANALNRTKFLAVTEGDMANDEDMKTKNQRQADLPSTIVFVEVARIFERAEVIFGKEATERAVFLFGKRIERAERHEIEYIATSEIGTGCPGIEAGGDVWPIDVEPLVSLHVGIADIGTHRIVQGIIEL